MGLKDVGKSMGNIAFRLAMFSCGGECRKCGICQNHSPSMSQDERQSRGNENWVVMTKSGGDDMR